MTREQVTSAVGVLTREQVERACIGLLDDEAIKQGRLGLTTIILLLSVHDDALRAQLAQVTRERDTRSAAMHTLRAGYEACIAHLEARLAQRDAAIEGLQAQITALKEPQP